MRAKREKLVALTRGDARERFDAVKFFASGNEISSRKPEEAVIRIARARDDDKESPTR